MIDVHATTVEAQDRDPSERGYAHHSPGGAGYDPSLQWEPADEGTGARYQKYWDKISETMMKRKERNDVSTEVKSLSVYDRMPDPLAAVRELGHAIAHSQMFGCANEEQGRVLAMTCFAKRMDPLALAERYHLIQGRLSMRADAMLAGLHTRGGSHKIIRRTADAAEIEITIAGETQRFDLTWTEAEKEPFVWGKEKNGKRQLKDNWATPRGRMQMLWARVVSDGVRAMCPEVVSGAYAPEELGDVLLPDGNEDSLDVPFEVAAEEPKPAGPPLGEILYATAEQAQAILDLYVSLSVPHEVQEAALAKRGVKSLRSLTVSQADEILGKLRSRAASQVELAEQSRAKPAATTATNNSPCTQPQIDAVKDLIREVSQNGQPDIADRIKQRLAVQGLAKIADLTMSECDQLKAALGLRNLEVWAAGQIEGHKSLAGGATPKN